jgi:hypothetical protein
MLNKEFEYYLDNQDELVKLYNGKYLIIKDKSVVGSFEKEEDALYSALDKYEQGTYIIQKCSPGEWDYAQMFHSRVSFSYA